MTVAGFGFRAGATTESLRDAMARATGGAVPDVLATAAGKAETPVFRDFAASIGLSVLAIAPEDLAQQSTPTQSEAARAAHGTGSVAEAAALAGAGPRADLLATRVVSGDRMATCALAKGEGD